MIYDFVFFLVSGMLQKKASREWQKPTALNNAGARRVPSASFRGAKIDLRRDNIKIGRRAEANASCWRIFFLGRVQRGTQHRIAEEPIQRRRSPWQRRPSHQHLGATSQTHITHIIQQQMHECGGEQENYCWPSSGMFISLLIFQKPPLPPRARQTSDFYHSCSPCTYKCAPLRTQNATYLFLMDF